MNVEERRKIVRRSADRELRAQLERISRLPDQRGDAGKEERRKRRHAIRHTCQVKIEMLIGKAGGFSNDWLVDAVDIRGRLLDLSADGASLFTKQPLETGQELRLAVGLLDSLCIHTGATVRWVKALPDKDGYASGAQFNHLPKEDQQRLNSFLAELETTAGL
jgi:hypothetical protein